VMSQNAQELLGHEEVQQLLDLLAGSSPKLAEELTKKVSVSVILKVLQNLLREQVPIRDVRTIAENLTDAAAVSQDVGALTAAVRVALSRLILQEINGSAPEVPVITIDPQLEQLLLKSFQQGGGDEGLALEPGMAERLQRSLNQAAERQEAAGKPAILLVAAPIRSLMARFVRYGSQPVHVLSYQEVPENKQVTIVATVGG